MLGQGCHFLEKGQGNGKSQGNFVKSQGILKFHRSQGILKKSQGIWTEILILKRIIEFLLKISVNGKKNTDLIEYLNILY